MSDDCGCCTGITTSTPGVIGNRPGLGEIAYRSGTHGDFLASMLAGLSRSHRPTLQGLRTRDPDDPTIALLDSWAVACDVLTFYSERLANESYLRTCTERTSLQELGKLLAYRLNPGVAAETWLAFSLERPPATVVLDPPDPGQSPPAVPSAVALPTGLRVQSVPGPGELPQTFETIEEIEARPEWNALTAARTKLHLPIINRVDAWLDGVGLNLAKGDAILFASDDLDNDRWDARLLTQVDVDAPGNRTHVRWEYGLGSFQPYNKPADAPKAFVLRKRLAVFGHNAPVWSAMNTTFKTGYQDSHKFPTGTPESAKTEWPKFTSVTQKGLFKYVDLDGAHPDVVRGSWVVVSQDDEESFYRELYEVVGRSELSRSEFGVSGKVTRLKLKGEWHAFGTPREVTVMAVSEPLTVVEAPDASPVSGSTVVVDGDATGMVEGRTLVVAGVSPAGEARSEVVTVVSAAPVGPDRTMLSLLEPLDDSYQRSSAVVFGNVAHATHGETVTEVLGSGDARTPFQSFALKQSPLTFVPAENPRGNSSTLEVSVDGVRWTELPSAYGATSKDRTFVTRDEPDGKVSTVFGDGQRGARVSTGSNNVRARYRKGIGAAGNARRDQVSQALDRPLGLRGVTNPVAATGGVDPEAEAHARVSIPIPVRTLGRAVSLQDFADFALGFTGIGKASAAVLDLRTGRTIVVSVADSEGVPVPFTTVDRLEDEIVAKSDPTVRVRALPCRSAGFRVAMKVLRDPRHERETVQAAVESALQSAYGAPARELGQPVHRSALVALAAAVPGVVAVDLDFLHRSNNAPTSQKRLVADPARVVGGEPLAAELLALTDVDVVLQELS